MSEQKRQNLDWDLDGLDLISNKQQNTGLPSQKVISEVTTFPSREAIAIEEDQLNIKGPKAVLDRFRALRKSERYKYADLLEFMMDAYERKNAA